MLFFVLDFIDFLKFLMVFAILSCKNALHSGLHSSPRTQSRHQMGFNIFWFFAFHEYHPRFSSFLAKKSWIPSKFSKNQWNTGQKIKKIRAVYVEILLWWYFGQKYSHFHTIMRWFLWFDLKLNTEWYIQPINYK